jgi:purine-nucleoside phosphorylase
MLRSRYRGVPSVGLALGSGWSGAAEGVAEATGTETIPYSDIPGFPRCSVEGHLGTLLVGRGWGPVTATLLGRVHRYEGVSWDDVTFSVRVLGAWGVKTLVVTNASGGLQDVEPGDLVLIADHINLMGENALLGRHWAEARFVDMVGAYDPELMRLAEEVAREAGIVVKRGTLAALPGPTYETSAEAKMLRILGANMVCMSTVPELMAARALCIRVLGLSLVTNMSGISDSGRNTHEAVVAMGARKADPMRRLLQGIVGRLHG